MQMKRMRAVYGEDKENLDKVKLVDVEFFASEYEGKFCIGIGTKGDEQGIQALCEVFGIDLKDFMIELQSLSAAFGKTFSEVIEELATKNIDKNVGAERMN